MPKKRPVLFGKKFGPLPLSAIQKQNAEIERAKRRRILARTHAGRARLAAIAAAADMTDVADLPIITGLAPPKITKNPRAKVAAPLGDVAVANGEFLERMKAPAPPRKQRKQRKKAQPAGLHRRAGHDLNPFPDQPAAL